MSEVSGESAQQGTSPETSVVGFKLTFSSVDLLKVLGGMVVLGGLVLHLIGVATHDAYLREWGVDSALFPKPIDRVLIDGYEGLLVSALKLWPQVLENIVYLVLFAVVVTVYWMAFRELSRRVDAMEVAPRWFSDRPAWVQGMFARFMLVLCTAVALPIAVWFVSVLLALPVVLAEYNGKSHAVEERERFAKGCVAASATRCFSLKRGTESVGRGLLIDSSPEYIAFYDVSAAAVRIVARQGLEVTVGAPH